MLFSSARTTYLVGTTVALFCGASVVGNASRCRADLLAWEPFDYEPNTTLAGRSNGFGFSGEWVLGGLGAPQHQVAAGSLVNVTDQLRRAGNRATVAEVSPSGFTTARRELVEPFGTPGTTRYISFLLRPEGELGAGDAGGYFGLELVSGATPLFVGKPSAEEYTIENIGGTGQFPTDIAAAVDETVLLVVRADFHSGQDEFRLYVDPDPVGFEEPMTADAIKSDSDVGIVAAVGMFSTGAFSVDELRIGETFGDVTPIPEPITLSLAAIGWLLLGTSRRRE